MPLRLPAAPKLSAWFGWAPLVPAAGGRVVVVVEPGAAVVVVTTASA
jgi:hypothetical protein